MKEIDVGRKGERLFDSAKRLLGIFAIIVGLLGLLLPVLPGWIFIFLGLELLGIEILFVEKIKQFALNKIYKEKNNKRG